METIIETIWTAHPVMIFFGVAIIGAFMAGIFSR